MSKCKTYLPVMIYLVSAFVLEAATPTPIPAATPTPLEQFPAGNTNFITLGALCLVVIILAGIAWNAKQQK